MSKQEKTLGRPGEFRGDFTRDTFDQANQYSRVFMQQGRVSIDADWNEQVSILHHYQRLSTTAIIGPHAAPWNCPQDFRLWVSENREEYGLAPGHYYVNGILCVNQDKEYQGRVADLLECNPDDNEFELDSYLFYLDVWESHITYIDDDSIREQALGGADTATRAKVMWKVRCKELDEAELAQVRNMLQVGPSGENIGIGYADFLTLIDRYRKPGNGVMRARAGELDEEEDPCASDASEGYRGKENQLYRVEICRSDSEHVSFKWSRENSSVMFAVDSIENNVISLKNLGGNICECLRVNDWVQVITGDEDCCCQDCVLYQVVEIDEEAYSVTLSENVIGDFDEEALAAAYLRLWDHEDGDQHGIPLAKAVDDWYELEDGIEIRFHAPSSGEEVVEDPATGVTRRVEAISYQPGDYWLIPARAGSNSIEWPTDPDSKKAAALPPHGVVHHYAPLRLIIGGVAGTDNTGADLDLRRVITRNWEPAALAAGAAEFERVVLGDPPIPVEPARPGAGTTSVRKKAKKKSKRKRAKRTTRKK